MAGVDLKHRADLLRLLPELFEHFLHPRAHVVIVGDQTDGRRRQPTGKSHLLYLVLQVNAQAREKIAVFAALVLQRLDLLLALLLGPELDLAAPDRLQRLVLELDVLAQPDLVDGIREEEHLVSFLDERLEQGRLGDRFSGRARQVVDGVLPLLHAKDVRVERRQRGRAGRRLGDDEVEELVLVLDVEAEKPFFEHRTELRPELEVLLRALLLHLLEHREHTLDELLADDLDLPIFLQDLARDVQRQVVRVDHPLDEAHVLREQFLALVHDENAFDVERDAALHLRAVEIERRLRGDVEQRVRFDGALHPDRNRAERLGPVVRDVAVELPVLALRYFGFGAIPDRLHRIQGLVLENFDLGRLVVFLAPSRHSDRIGDEIRIALDDALDHALLGVVVQPLLGVHRLEMEGHRRPRLFSRALAYRVGAVARRFPRRGHGCPRTPRQDLDLVGHHERRIEAHAELADEVRRHLLAARALDGREKLLGSRFRDRADVRDHIGLRHPDAVVEDRERALRLVDHDPNMKVIPRTEVG